MNFETLQKELQRSIKDKNRVRKNVIADMITQAKNAAIAQGTKDAISDDIVDAAILKSKKICQEQIDTCPANRPDLLEGFRLCMTYIDEFAPRQMTENEVMDAVSEILNERFPHKPSKGEAMKIIMPLLKGRADGKLINKVVSNILK